MSQSDALFERAKQVMPGGVNSPVRAFGSVGRTPRFIRAAKGAYLQDVDGNRYLDFVCSWGPMITGHCNQAILDAIAKTMQDGLSFGAATELEVDMAELLCSIVPSLEMVRMVNSGTEAVMSALRLARGYTNREKIVKFAGCYHGHSDSMLVKAGSGVLTQGNPDSAGVSTGVAKDTLIAQYNDIDSVRALFDNNKDEIACVIIEPVAANMGVIAPSKGFLQALRTLCDANGALLIFDEVITGFRLALGGAQEYFGVKADLVTYGKIIGAGLPVGAYGGSREIMQCIAPLGNVYQAGTLSGNPLAMSAGIVGVTLLRDHPEIYSHINTLGQTLAAGLRKAGFEQVNQVGSLVSPFFTKNPVLNYQDAKTSDTDAFADYFGFMLDHGVYLAPSQFEAMFIANDHTEAEIAQVIALASEYNKK